MENSDPRRPGSRKVMDRDFGGLDALGSKVVASRRQLGDFSATGKRYLKDMVS